MSEEKKHKKHHGFSHTHVEHFKDGSASVHHVHSDPTKDVKHAASDLDAVHDSMQEHLGQPNLGEEANAAQPDAQAPTAAPAAALPPMLTGA